MLMFCLKIFALPDATERSWKLSKVFSAADEAAGNASLMREWLKKVINLRHKILPGFQLLQLMLTEDPSARPGAETIVKGLSELKKQ